jgi:hypothetical protein
VALRLYARRFLQAIGTSSSAPNAAVSPESLPAARSEGAEGLCLGPGTFTAGEVLNVLNHKNEYNVQTTMVFLARTGRTSRPARGLPIAPAIGLSIGFSLGFRLWALGFG